MPTRLEHQSHRPYSTKRNRTSKHLRDLNGVWSLDRTLSTGLPPALALQGLDSAARKAIIASPLRMTVSQSNYPSQIFVKQWQGMQTERFFPPQRIGTWSEWAGSGSATRGRCRWVREIEDSSSDGWSTVGGSSTATEGGFVEEEFLLEDVRRMDGCEFLEVEVESTGWSARQVWVVDGSARLVRRIVTWGRDGKRAETRLVYGLVD